jgi:hypothetical protein
MAASIPGYGAADGADGGNDDDDDYDGNDDNGAPGGATGCCRRACVSPLVLTIGGGLACGTDGVRGPVRGSCTDSTS